MEPGVGRWGRDAEPVAMADDVCGEAVVIESPVTGGAEDGEGRVREAVGDVDCEGRE